MRYVAMLVVTGGTLAVRPPAIFGTFAIFDLHLPCIHLAKYSSVIRATSTNILHAHRNELYSVDE